MFYLGWQVAGLPFAPYDTFDWLACVLPGRVLGPGMGSKVTIIPGLHLGATAAPPEIATLATAIATMFIVGCVWGCLLLIILRRWRVRRVRQADHLGLAFGLALGVPEAVINHYVSQSAVIAPAANVVWIVAACLLWGLVLGRTYHRLARSAPAV
jgi:hypothetical protein